MSSPELAVLCDQDYVHTGALTADHVVWLQLCAIWCTDCRVCCVTRTMCTLVRCHHGCRTLCWISCCLHSENYLETYTTRRYSSPVDLSSSFNRLLITFSLSQLLGGTAVAAPPPFRPGDPALCGSCPLVTPYYCRLGDLLCLFV